MKQRQNQPKKVKKQRNLKIFSEFIPSGKAKEEKDI